MTGETEHKGSTLAGGGAGGQVLFASYLHARSALPGAFAELELPPNLAALPTEGSARRSELALELPR